MMSADNDFKNAAWEKDRADRPQWQRGLPSAAIITATFVAYAATLSFGFVFDDHVLIEQNDSLRSWRYLPDYFAAHIWSFRYPHLLSNAYRPFLLIWLRLNDVMFGLHAWGWHLTLVAAHVAVTYLVYRLALRLTRDTWSAVAGALVFGLHPVHVETIAEAAWADQPLATLFVLATLLTWWRSREPGRKYAWLAASLALCAAALLSKESSLVLPILVSGLAWLYGGASGREVARDGGRIHPPLERLRSALGAAIPYWAVILVYVPVRMQALKGFVHVVTPLSLHREVLTIPSVLLFYLRLLVWPFGLSCYYDTPYVATPGWHDFVLPALLVAAVAAALAIWYWRTSQSVPEEAKAIEFVCLWMILTLLPVLNFRLLPQSEIAHDRYVYLPSVGFALLVAIALRQALRGGGYIQPRPAWLAAGTVVACLLMGFATLRQSLYWSDDLTLNFRAHEIAPHNVSATTSLAAAVAQRGMDGPAMALYQQALAIQPDFWRANVNLAYLYYAHGNFPEAGYFFARACAADPTDGDQFLYLGMALLRMGQFTEAEKAVSTALLVRPQGKNYHLGLGMVLRGEGRLVEAQTEIERELAENPQNTQAQALQKEVVQQIQAAPEKLLSRRPPNASPGP